jgi:hypothetical protein
VFVVMTTTNEVVVLLCAACGVRYFVLSGEILTTCPECNRALVRGGLSGRIERLPS